MRSVEFSRRSWSNASGALLLVLAACAPSSSGDAVVGGAGVPVASFSAAGTSGVPPLVVTFTDTSTGDVTSWSWSFGDGATSGERNPVHSYAALGNFSVSLAVTGPEGADTETRANLIHVTTAEGPVADFSAISAAGDAPLAVEFSDLSSGVVTGWSWDFGDGGTSAVQNPVHTYQDPDSYAVTLTVTGPDGSDSATKAGFIRVFDGDVQGVWSSAREIESLPTTGSAWSNLLAEADRATGTPDVSNQDDDTDVRVLAKALVYARTGTESYRTQVIDACMDAIGTEAGGRTLALGRNLIGYVVAADLVGLPATEDAAFRAWLERCLTETLDGRTLVSTHEDRPNNWGTHAGASRAAVAVYLGDTAELERCAKVFHGWVGNRAEYSGFEYAELDWQADPSNPVGINPVGATKSGQSLDGVLPDDQRRAGGFTWPPPKENYVWEALQGAIAQAVILHRAGYDVWEWEDQALLRAIRWLHEQCSFPASGDDTWQPHIVNFFYGSDFPAPEPSSPGKNMGWADWTHPAP